MKIGLIGYGKMGKMVERLAAERGHHASVILERGDDISLVDQSDICIEFTSPQSVIENIRKVAARGKNLVVGTTGWFDRLDEVKEIVKESDIGLLYAPNFSVGMHLFLSVVNEAAKIGFTIVFQSQPIRENLSSNLNP